MIDYDEHNASDEGDSSDWCTEEDYWYIDDGEQPCEHLNLPDFYETCLNRFAEVAKRKGIIQEFKVPKGKSIQIGEKIVSSYLTDRYIGHRRKSQPEAYYPYEVELALEAGIALAKKKQEHTLFISKYVDKIVRETPYEDVSKMCGKELPWQDYGELTLFINEVTQTWHEELKWYFKHADFDEYLKKSLLAAFCLGWMIYSANKK